MSNFIDFLNKENAERAEEADQNIDSVKDTDTPEDEIPDSED